MSSRRGLLRSGGGAGSSAAAGAVRVAGYGPAHAVAYGGADVVGLPDDAGPPVGDRVGADGFPPLVGRGGVFHDGSFLVAFIRVKI